jgi:hypothetical protein
MTKIILESSNQIPEKVTLDNPEKTKSNNFFNKHVNLEKIKVTQTGFYDLGFDPDFSVDGNIFYKKQPVYKEQPNFSFFHSLIKMVYNIIKYFLKTPEEKAFQELVQIEKKWHEAGINKRMLYFPTQDEIEKGVMAIISYEIKLAPNMCHLREYQFFKKLSKIDNSSEPYVGDLLRPLHLFNRPQAPSKQSKEQILKGECLRNEDVARLGKWGFSLLGNHVEEPISHKEFLEAIDKSGDQFKLAIRDLRSVIRKQNYREFTSLLKNVRKAWGGYINSHKLLKDLAVLYAQEDYFEESYKTYEENYHKMKKIDFNNMDDFLKIQGEAKDKITELSNAAYTRLKKKMS